MLSWLNLNNIIFQQIRFTFFIALQDVLYMEFQKKYVIYLEDSRFHSQTHIHMYFMQS